MTKHTSKIAIHASPERVFAALTQPELVALWQFARMLKTTWAVGSEIRFRTECENERVLEQWGTVLDVRKNELVRYRLFTPQPGLEGATGKYSVTSYVLTRDNKETTVELIHEAQGPSSIVPASLGNILVALKEVAEAH